MTNNSFTTRPVHKIRVILFALTVLFFTVSCTKNNTPDIPIAQVPDTTAILKYRGLFQPTSGINITGAAKVYLKNNIYQLGLDSFSVTNGPDLKVYLSKDYPPANFIILGPLQSISGFQLYMIPGEPDFSAYKYVLIHCQQYNHLFGIAELNP